MAIDLTKMTFGAEHELADWPARDLATPFFGLSRDLKDVTIVNSNGIANDPTLKYYWIGGEINTSPTDTVAGQSEVFANILARWPSAMINYRSNLHFHVRVSGLSEDLIYLKRLALYNDYWLWRILDTVEPIPHPILSEHPENLLAEKGAMRRFRRRKVSHHTILPKKRLERQLQADTVERFHEAEVPRPLAGGPPMWHAQPRAAVNVRQLLQTDTIEFRHFPGTLSCTKLFAVGQWCSCYIECALSDWSEPEDVDPLQCYLDRGNQLELIPKFEPYQHNLEIRYRATCHDGSVPKALIRSNIAAILDGSFNAEAWEQWLKW